jgi:hypothetical protein
VLIGSKHLVARNFTAYLGLLCQKSHQWNGGCLDGGALKNFAPRIFGIELA